MIIEATSTETPTNKDAVIPTSNSKTADTVKRLLL